MVQRQMLVWLIRGLGGIVRMFAEWSETFGKMKRSDYDVVVYWTQQLIKLPYDERT